MSYSLGLDVGTQSTKAVLLDESRRGAAAIVARASRSYGLIEGLPQGAAEQHPDTWRQAVREVIGEVLQSARGGAVRAVGVSGQQHGLVVLDASDQVVRPAKLWCDTTTSAEAEAITQQGKWAVSTGFTSPKMLWLKRHEPAHWARVTSVLLPHDYINFLLTGRKFAECGDASGTGAFNPEARAYDRDTLGFIDPRAESMMPELIPAHRAGGRVSAQAAAEFGLPEGAFVAPGGGDNMMSAIGSGATRAGVTVVSLGTSGTAFAYAPQVFIDPEGLIAGFCDSTGGWLPLLCTMNVTGVTESVRQMFGHTDHAALTRAAEQVPAGGEGLLLLPYLQGERVPNLPHATGTLLGMRAQLLTPGHLYRAAVEGTTLGMVSGIRRMQELGIELDSLRLVGGGSKNPLWRQVFADALQVPVRRLAEAESAALGAAIQASWIAECENGASVGADEVANRFVEASSEVTEPIAAHAGVYEEALTRLQATTRTLHGA